MKKILILALLISAVTYGQKHQVKVLKKVHVTTAQRDLYVVPVGQTWEIYNSTTGQKEKNIGGAGWVSDEGTGSGLSQSDLDTFAELDAIVADETLLKASDISASVQGYNANTDINANDDVNLTGDQPTIAGLKGFSGAIQSNGSFTGDNGSTSVGGASLASGDNYLRINGYSFSPPTEAYISFLIDDTAGGLNPITKYLIASENDITYDGMSLLGSGSAPPFDDTTIISRDPVDNTKGWRADVGNVPNSTTAVVTIGSDVDLRNMADVTANNTFTGQSVLQGTTYFESAVTRIRRSGFATAFYQMENSTGVGAFGLDGTSFVLDMDASFNDLRIRDNLSASIATFDRATKNTTFYGNIIKNGATSDDVLLGDGTTTSLAGIGGGIPLDPASPSTFNLWWLGTQAQYDALGSPAATTNHIISDPAPAQTGTGSALNMSGYFQYNFSAASSSATFTMTDIRRGGYAECLINKSGAAPTVTGATQRPNTLAFSASTDMILHVKDYDGTRKYWFTEY